MYCVIMAATLNVKNMTCCPVYRKNTNKAKTPTAECNSTGQVKGQKQFTHSSGGTYSWELFVAKTNGKAIKTYLNKKEDNADNY